MSIVDAIWITSTSFALAISTASIALTVRSAYLLWQSGGNGARRLNLVRQFIGELPLFATLITFTVLGLDAINSPRAGKDTKLFFIGVVLILALPYLYAAVSIFFLAYRKIFKSHAALVDTAPQKAISEKAPQIKALAVLPLAKNSYPLDLSKEFKKITTANRTIEWQTLIGFDITNNELQKECLRRTINILHVASHGDEEQGILLSDGYIDADSLVSIVLASGARVIVLSACDTEETADALLALIDGISVIYVRTKISDKHAIAFAKPFHRGLGKGLSVARSFALGCTMLPPEVRSSAMRLDGDKEFKFDIKKRK